MCHPEEVIVSVAAVAAGISRGLSAEDTDLLAAVFTLLGDSLAALSAAKAKIEVQNAVCNASNE